MMVTRLWDWLAFWQFDGLATIDGLYFILSWIVNNLLSFCTTTNIVVRFWNNNPGLIRLASTLALTPATVENARLLTSPFFDALDKWLPWTSDGVRKWRMLWAARFPWHLRYWGAVETRGNNELLLVVWGFRGEKGVRFLPGMEDEVRVGRWEMAGQLGWQNLMNFYRNWKEREKQPLTSSFPP